jgi:hypothetical protein
MIDYFLMTFIASVVLVGIGGFIYANWSEK